ncbi:MAG: hypothetical protein A2751_04390 [Candidatus Doudnabacteria bacterium RIFCSPHIGHO2_01_FULL_46_14]|uniref:DUF192 domain-containing protein n=1 Tax=Candidatus Doudnabacteria bacterium RIFCSPHIGHO2_01_FULL_46_14 TaxID=1817824 RepID=A0A1F5NNV3_9BACT|nr:MAG: hypothetical protein A2751_04390 [Candidatus Doudnabacteria bacterium RIFCSPHIGHO2_01_FULL_46_14]
MKYFIIILILLIAGGVYYFQKQTQDLEVADFQVGNKQIKVEIADTIAKQAQGLSGRDSLCLDCGMLFTYQKPKFQRFTMQGMRFPLDMIFIENGKIVEIREGLRYPENGEEPVIIQSSFESDMVLEVNEGFVWRNRLQVGESAVLTRN